MKEVSMKMASVKKAREGKMRTRERRRLFLVRLEERGRG